MILELKDVKKSFDKPVLKGVTFTMKNGVYGLLGPNGAGKSTLIHIICDIDRPKAGQVMYDHKPIQTLDKLYRDKIGYVPQSIGFYPNYTAYQFLEYMAVIKNISKCEIKSRINEVLDIVSLHEQKKKIKHFSGGMKQRLGIAQALLNKPDILILDEPTVGLDLEERMNFKQFISSYAAEHIVLFATHIVSDIEDIGNEILILKDGVIKIQDSPERLLKLISGKVWEITCAKEESYKYKKMYRVSNTRFLESGVIVRLISDTMPDKNAVNVDGNLQDLYLYLFGEDEW